MSRPRLSGPSREPGLLVKLLGVATTIVAVGLLAFLGAFVLAALVGLFAILAAYFAVRHWWRGRRGGRGANAARSGDRPIREIIIEKRPADRTGPDDTVSRG